MSGFLLDTNVISELVKAKPEPRVTKWIETTEETLLYLSVLTLGEIRKGIASLPHSARRVRARSLARPRTRTSLLRPHPANRSAGRRSLGANRGGRSRKEITPPCY
jgi:predicted nucleic acid-binding protein